MAETYGPFDTGAGASFSEDGWGKLMRAMAPDGVIFQRSGEISTPYTGPEFNGLKVTAGAGLSVNVGVGTAQGRGVLYENTSSKNIVLETAPATAGQSRFDVIVVRIDKSANTAVATYVKGTAAASPVVPGITRSQNVIEIPLAYVAIGTNAVVVGTITDARQLSFLTPDYMYCRATKVAGQIADAARATWTFAGGNSGYLVSNQFVIPCNGLWTVEYFFSVIWGSSQTGLTGSISLNGTEIKREGTSVSGLSTVKNAVTVDIDSRHFKTGDLLEANVNSHGDTSRTIQTESYAQLTYVGTSKEPVW